MTTAAVLTPEQESVSSRREKQYQQANTLASQDAGNPNPFLDVRRAWNGVWEESLANGRRWRLMALVEAGLLALAFWSDPFRESAQSHSLRGRGEKLGEVAYSGPRQPAQADSNAIKASIATFISDLRLDGVRLQAEAINWVYAYLSKGDPALGRVDSYYGATKEASPYVRAQDEIVWSRSIMFCRPASPPGRSIGPRPRATARQKKR